MKKIVIMVLLFAIGLICWKVDLRIHAIISYYKLLEEYSKNPSLLIIFYSLYALGVAFSLPCVMLGNILGGIVFGKYTGFLGAMIAYTSGAMVNYALIQWFFYDYIYQRFYSTIDKVKMFLGNSIIFNMIGLRLIPIFPFLLTNFSASILNIGYRQYFISTFIGIIPQTWIFNYLGAKAGYTLNNFNPNRLINPEDVLVLSLLGLMMMLPLAWKISRKKAFQKN